MVFSMRISASRTIKMKSSSLLLIISLLTGCEAKSEVRGCQEGWIEFTCKYPETNRKYERVDVVTPRQMFTEIIQEDVRKTKGSISLYYDTKNTELKVAIKQLKREDSGSYKCKFYQRQILTHETEELHLLVESIGCQQPFIQTAYRTAKTTIKCDNPRYKYSNRSSVKFFCKENHSACEDILFAPKSNRRFSLTETSSGFSMSISNVSSHDSGVYWCGVVPNEGRAAVRKIRLKVEGIINFTRSPTSGQDFTYWCKYPDGSPIKKFICKGEDPSICEPLANTGNTHNNKRFVMKENKPRTSNTITVRNVRAEDAGTYWCGAESTDGKHSNPFYHRFTMSVVPASTIPGSNSSIQSHPSPPITTDNVELAHDSQFAITVIVCAAVLLLLFIILISIYKRCSHSENTGSEAAAQPIREDYIYEEIQEKVQKPDSGTAVSTIYSTANSPSDPSASLHYCTIEFKNSSEQTGGEELTVKSRSACEYSTVNYSQSPTYVTVNPPSRSSQEPLKPTVNKPQ